ncbi:MAG: NAD-dependent epimerase/dehydratase family protein [Candidatus Peribacteraceae bacterium]|nr:NAD-dependent epimerase/dehydratase family protein [Candidatus Peribacteraceae bacterium]
MIKQANVLITGGLGAIGSALCRRLLTSKVERLVIIDDCSSGDPRLSRDVLDDPRVTLVRGSVTDEAALERAFAVAPRIVFHLAAHFANQNSVDHPVIDCEVNSIGTIRMLEHARRARVSKFVFASSSCVYGSADSFAVDTRDFRLDTPYAINKLHGEYLVRFYHEYFGMDTTILRYFNSFGPGELPGLYRNVVPNFFALAMRGEPLPITGDPNAGRDFTFVGNTVEATLLAAEKPISAGRTYNVGTGMHVTVGELAEHINNIAGNTAGTILKPGRQWDHVFRRVADISRTTEDLQYRPVIDLPSQLRETYEWLLRHKDSFHAA